MDGVCEKNNCSHFGSCVDLRMCDEWPCVGVKVTPGIMVATMFFLREAARLKGVKTLCNLTGYLSEYNVAFRNVDTEMFFSAELQHLRYYPVDDFDRLCFQCLDFSTLKQKPTRYDVGEWRGNPRGPFPKTYR